MSAEDAGISALFIHGRTKTQGYSGTVDYGLIREVKSALKIPVIASGDNLSAPSIRKMFDETGCDGVAIARGALGNPWIFREVFQFLRGGTPVPRPDIAERIDVIKRHLELSIQHYGERRGVATFHKFFIWYTRGLLHIKPLRDKAFRADRLDDLLSIIEELRVLACLTPSHETSPMPAVLC
jgi:tRNA-dihydrouridine synthase B